MKYIFPDEIFSVYNVHVYIDISVKPKNEHLSGVWRNNVIYLLIGTGIHRNIFDILSCKYIENTECDFFLIKYVFTVLCYYGSFDFLSTLE